MIQSKTMCFKDYNDISNKLYKKDGVFYICYNLCHAKGIMISLATTF